MDIKFENLNSFFEKIKNIGFLQRVFFWSWRQIRNLSYDAYKEFAELLGTLNRVTTEVEESKKSIAVLENDNDHLKSEKDKLDRSLESTKEKIEKLTDEVSKLNQKNAVFEQTVTDRKSEYDNKVATLDSVIKRNQEEREKEKDELHKQEIQRLESMKETWVKHQDNVKNFIKDICLRCNIEYVDKVPFKGNPDNTIKICDEFVIFDAKSPKSLEDLKNFPLYIKDQAERVVKYIKENNVRRDIYFVIPLNSAEVLEKFYYNMADYNVYVVTLDVLEPLMLSLKKIESYEFMNQLTPEERENICRIIGKFAHMTKRRIQIDHFFAREFLNILTKCEADLPGDILQEVGNFEKAEMLNPPQARRTKQIPTLELESDTQKIQREAEAKGISFPSSVQKDLKGLPLYEDEQIAKDGIKTP